MKTLISPTYVLRMHRKTYRNGLDKRYKIATENLRFTLNSAENKIINIYIVKQQTEIKFQQEPVKVEYNSSKK